MSQSKRIIITILAIVGFFSLFAVVIGIGTKAGTNTPGILGIGLLAGLYFGLKAIWRKPEQDFQEDEEFEEYEEEEQQQEDEEER
ncbi:MAG: hypothetical protein WC135_08660 [Bacteroidales bacterium]